MFITNHPFSWARVYWLHETLAVVIFCCPAILKRENLPSMLDLELDYRKAVSITQKLFV